MARNTNQYAQILQQFSGLTNESDNNTDPNLQPYPVKTPNKGGRPVKGTARRDKKVTLLLTADLHERLKESAYKHRKSVNDLIFSILEDQIESRDELGL